MSQFRNVLTISLFLAILSCFTLPLQAQEYYKIGIRIDEGKARFYNKLTNERFVPRGFNYIQLVNSPNGPYGESELFHPDSHDLIAIDDDFQRMSALGYNSIRVFIDLCRETRCIANENGLITTYIENIASLLERAKKYGLYVMLTANWLPDFGGYSNPAHEICHASGEFVGGNCLVMSTKGVELYGTFFSDFVQALLEVGAPMDAIWAYELRNEFFVEHNYPPFTFNSGMVQTANGMSYDMSSGSDKTQMGEDAVVFWANSTRDAIQQVTPDALVTSGFFTPNEPNILREDDPRIVPFVAALEESELDFFGIHAYAGFHDFQLEAENYQIINYTTKPIVLGEYGVFLPDAPTEYLAAQIVDHWQSVACSFGVEGFTFWTWDRHRTSSSNPDDPWAGSDEKAFIAKVLSPFNKPNSCEVLLPEQNVAKGKPTSASMEWEEFVSSNIVDGNATQTPWIAGSDPPQWIEVDLQAIYDLESIQIVVETGSDDPFQYTHHLEVKANEADTYQLLHIFSGERINLQLLSFQNGDGSLITNVRFIRISIPQAPGWAALHELRALLPEMRDAYDVPPPPILSHPRPGLEQINGDYIRWKNDTPNLPASVQIAADSSFQNIIEEINNITGGLYDISHLSRDAKLFWRVKQENQYGFSFWSVIGEIDAITVSNIEIEDYKLSIYPNPVIDVLVVEDPKVELLERHLNIYSTTGKKIFASKWYGQKNELNISWLSDGAYFLQLTDKYKTRSIKFIKSK